MVTGTRLTSSSKSRQPSPVKCDEPKVLQFVAKQLKRSIKGRDFICRFGGEEFAIILPQTEIKSALIVANQLRQCVAKNRLKRANSEEVYGHVTLSFGVAELRPDETRNDLIDRADRALYLAKNKGRNRVEAFVETELTEQR